MCLMHVFSVCIHKSNLNFFGSVSFAIWANKGLCALVMITRNCLSRLAQDLTPVDHQIMGANTYVKVVTLQRAS